jgi:hypothetical protein
MDNDWYQQMLTPPDVIEVRIRIGVIPSADHVQAQVELVDPQTSILVGQWSKPHGRMTNLRTSIAWAAAKAIEAVEETIPPF